MIRAVLHVIVKEWKQQRYTSIDEWISNIGHVHTMKYHLAIKRKEILTYITIWMKPGPTMLSEISQSEKDQCSMIPII